MDFDIGAGAMSINHVLTWTIGNEIISYGYLTASSKKETRYSRPVYLVYRVSLSSLLSEDAVKDFSKHSGDIGFSMRFDKVRFGGIALQSSLL